MTGFAAAPPVAPPLACGNCRAPMQRLVLAGHYGAEVEVDLCAACHLVWFDGTENVRLAGASLVELIDAMGRAQTLAHQPLGPSAGCARCGGALKTVHNRSRWGESTQLDCVRGHGSYRSFAQFVADRGLTRPLAHADRAALAARGETLPCIGCGAAIGAGDARCPQCDSLPALFDVGRLARSLDPEEALDPQPVHARRAEHRLHDCPACGAPQRQVSDFRCGHCGATLAVPRLADAAAAVRPLVEALRSHAAKPSPQTIARRLAVIDRNAGEQREWARRMQAEADAAAGRHEWDAEAFSRWDEWLDRWRGWPLARIGLFVAAVFFALAFFGRR